MSDFVYGRWPVKEALESGGVSKIYVSKGADRSSIKDILSAAKMKGVQFIFVDRRKIEEMAPGNHQGVVALVSPLRTRSFSEVLGGALANPPSGACLIFLDGVQDPQNIGSILRSAVFFGVRGVVVTKWRSAPLTSAVVRASAGTAGSIPIALVSNLATSIREAKKKGLWIVGADMAGESAKAADLARPFALVMGAEGEGLHRLIKENCDYVVKIPGDESRQGAESLNVSVACGILLNQFSGYN